MAALTGALVAVNLNNPARNGSETGYASLCCPGNGVLGFGAARVRAHLGRTVTASANSVVG
jgi:hypothetical protein